MTVRELRQVTKPWKPEWAKSYAFNGGSDRIKFGARKPDEWLRHYLVEDSVRWRPDRHLVLTETCTN